MKNELMVFEGSQVEIFELNNKILFNPKDVALCLGISDKFCKKREMHWYNNELTFLLDNEDINEFVDLIGYDCFCEGDIKVTLAGYHIGFDLIPFCEYVGIEPELILEREG